MDLTVFVGAQEFKDFSAGDDYFLGFVTTGEAAVDGTYDAGGLLEGEIVEIHGNGLLKP